jgi:predicted MFS family arabinose efflux permease
MVFVNVPGNLAGGWLLQRGFRRWRLIVFANLVMGLSGVALYLAWLPFPARYTACLALSLVGGLIPSSLLGGAPIYAPAPEQIATTNGLLIQGSQLGQVIGPPALALIVATGGWSSAPWLLGVSAIVGIVLALGLAALNHRRSAKPCV